MLAESLELFYPHLLPTLTNKEDLAVIRQIAPHLAPILRGCFECRLGEDTTIDFQQCIFPKPNEQDQLWAFIQAQQSSQKAWQNIERFLKADLIQKNKIGELWLEFDLDDSPLMIPVPSIFIGLPQDITPTSASYALSQQALELLFEQRWHSWQANIERCFQCCPQGIFVSHLGLMLSRSIPAIRVNVKRLNSDNIVDYLQQVRWPGDIAAVAVLMDQLFQFCDRLTVCLDVGEQVCPQLGLECIFLQQPEKDSRWQQLLDFFVLKQLCSPEKAESILQWPGQTNPCNISHTWPDDLILDSLIRHPNQFSLFQRKISHFKISITETFKLTAKAYLWFEHRFIPIKTEVI